MSTDQPNIAMKITAKPIEWEIDGEPAPSGEQVWFEREYGYSIRFDPDEEECFKYSATRGEDDSELFATLYEAREWCQRDINAWVRSIAVVELDQPNAAEQAPCRTPESSPGPGENTITPDIRRLIYAARKLCNLSGSASRAAEQSGLREALEPFKETK